jgi:hypothetical protein
MGIKVKHAPSAAAIGESAYTIGRGEKQRWATDIALKEQALDLQAASIRASSKARAGQLALQEEELAFRKEQWAEEPARQLEMSLQQQKILQSKVRWQYDESQKREMAKVTSGVSWLRDQVSAGKWTAEQAEQAELQLWRKYHSILPLPIYDDTLTPQERFNQGRVKDETTGAYYMEVGPGKFEPMGIDFKDYAKLRADVAKAFTTMDAEGNMKIDWEATDKFVDETMNRFTKIQNRAALAESEKQRLLQKAKDIEQQAAMMDQDIMERDAAAMQRTAEAPKSVLTKRQEAIDYVKGVLQQEQHALLTDKARRDIGVKMLAEAGFKVTADELKTEQARKPEPAIRKVAPEVDMTKLDDMAKNRIQQFKGMKNIKWSWVSQKFGPETAAELKYICESGNEQAIANALQRLGII